MRKDGLTLSRRNVPPVVDNPKLVEKAELLIGNRHVDGDLPVIADFRVIELFVAWPQVRVAGNKRSTVRNSSRRFMAHRVTAGSTLSRPRKVYARSLHDF